MMMRYKILFGLMLFGTMALAQSNTQATKDPTDQFFAPGTWRGIFSLKPGLDVPFNFLVETGADRLLKVYFLNAEEKFEGGKFRREGDSVFVSIDQFDNEFAFRIDGRNLAGVLRKQDGSGTPTPVTAVQVDRATPDHRPRFTGKTSTPAKDLSGTYDISFNPPEGKTEKAVGLFTQQGNHLRATFLRITGDSRYLEGVVDGDHFYLSSFIGSGPSFYRGSFDKDGVISGEIVGARGVLPFSGKPDENATLPDAYKLTFLKDGYKSLDFTFPDVNGKAVSLKDAKYKNKVVIITITGSWCPNCMDEASFLAPWYKANRARGVEAIGIHYEKQTDSAYARKVLTRFRNRYGIEYDQVIAGVADKQVVAASLPAINDFLSFPTTIIIGKDGQVAQIHTGYSGPATGKYYDEWVKEFNSEIDSLLAQTSLH